MFRLPPENWVEKMTVSEVDRLVFESYQHSKLDDIQICQRRNSVLLQDKFLHRKLQSNKDPSYGNRFKTHFVQYSKQEYLATFFFTKYTIACFKLTCFLERS